MRKTMRTAAALLLALSAVACSGPGRSFDVGVKEIETDVLLGPAPASEVPLPPPSADPGVGFPGFVQPPFVPPPDEPTPTPTPCPTAGPLEPVRAPVTTSAPRPPVAGAYGYRNDGSYTIGDASGRYPANTTRAITNVVNPAPGGGFTFDVSIPQPDGSVTFTTYRVFPPAPTPADPEGGLYIQRVMTKERDGSTHTFAPVPSLMLIRFPAAIGDTWTSRGIDPLAGTVMQFAGRIRARSIVDICGTRVGAWQVEITEGLIRSADRDITFTSVLHIAPQFGGLSLVDDVRQEGTDGDRKIALANVARISEVPDRP